MRRELLFIVRQESIVSGAFGYGLACGTCRDPKSVRLYSRGTVLEMDLIYSKERTIRAQVADQRRFLTKMISIITIQKLQD